MRSDPLLPHIPSHAEMLRNRLKKRKKVWEKWAQRLGTTAYRVYDLDIPEIPLYVDRYGDYAVVSWLIPRELRALEEEPLRHPWMQAMYEAIAQGLGFSQDQVFVRTRRPTRGAEQYDALQKKSVQTVVEEAGQNFMVNLSDYVDTGLFCDHRSTRALVREKAKGKTVLNLFGYTGAFAVQAAAGGASRTVTLDMSATYTAWATENYKRNGHFAPEHQARQVDVLDWLQRDAWREERFDIVILDPPTTSRSKRMNSSFDVQRDHALLLRQTRQLLAPGGSLMFSTNFRRFRPDDDAFAPFSSAEEITAQTIPEDFQRSAPHRAWWLTAT